MSRAEYRDQRPIPEILTPDHAAKLLFYSFKYAQGTPVQYFLIYQFFQENPQWKMEVENLDEVKKLSVHRIEKYFKKTDEVHSVLHTGYHYQVYSGGIEHQVKIYVELMNKTASEKRERNHNMNNLVNGLINADHQYLARTKPRHRTNPNLSNPSLDPYHSQLLWYGALGHNCEMPEYSHIFEDAWRHIQTNKISDKAKTELSEVLNVYQQQHPNQQVII